MIVLLGVLHWHGGEGLDIDQLPLAKISETDGGTGGVNQSEPLEEQGSFLEEEYAHKTRTFLTTTWFYKAREVLLVKQQSYDLIS